MVWRGLGQRGHYEGWYITLVDPKSGRGFWIRYTIHIPAGEQSASASVWAFTFDPRTESNSNSSGRGYGPLSTFKQNLKPWSVSIGSNNILNEKNAQGQISTKQGPLSWDLDLGPSTNAWEHFNPKLFDIGVSSTCVNSPRLSMPISGKVKLGTTTWTFKDAPGEQSHIWGRQPTTNYAWAHCNAFDNSDDGIFEGVNARIQKGPMTLPGAGPLLFQTEEQRFEVKGLIPMFQVTSDHEYGRWSFEAESGNQLLKGEVFAKPNDTIAVEYDDPYAKRRVFCHNSIVANMNLTLYKRKNVRWEPVLQRKSNGTTAFEITRLAPDPRVQRRLMLGDGRTLV